MPRTARMSVGGMCYHAMSRGNRRETVFHDDADYQGFLILVGRACEHVPMRVLGYCLMPNHFHLVLWPYEDGDMGRWMQRLLTGHVRRYNLRYSITGRIWEGRFKAPPVQNDEHLIRVLRYIERNPLRAGLVTDPVAWPWSSLRWWRVPGRPTWLHATDVVLKRDWPKVVAEPQSDAELGAIRCSLHRGAPFGDPSWTRRTASQLHLEHTLRAIGRPRA